MSQNCWSLPLSCFGIWCFKIVSLCHCHVLESDVSKLSVCHCHVSESDVSKLSVSAIVMFWNLMFQNCQSAIVMFRNLMFQNCQSLPLSCFRIWCLKIVSLCHCHVSESDVSKLSVSAIVMFRNLMSLNCQSLPLPAHAPLPPSPLPPPPPHTPFCDPAAWVCCFTRYQSLGEVTTNPVSMEEGQLVIRYNNGAACSKGGVMTTLIILSCDSTPGAVVTWYVMSPWIGVGGGGLVYWLILSVKCPVTRQEHMQAMLRPPTHKWKSSLLFTLHTPLCLKMVAGKNEVERTTHVEIAMARFLAVGRACKAIFSPVPGCEEGTLDSSGVPAAGTNILCVWCEGGKRNQSAIFQTVLSSVLCLQTLATSKMPGITIVVISMLLSSALCTRKPLSYNIPRNQA